MHNQTQSLYHYLINHLEISQQTMDQSFLFAVMLNILEKIFMVVTGGEFIIGILGNGFIGLTTCIAWIRNQKLSLLDFILTSLAFARIS